MLDFFKNLFSSQKMELNSYGRTDTGRVRDHNEDAFSILGDYRIFIVADGMGGHNAGEVASRVAIESLTSFYSRTAANSFHGSNNDIRRTLINSFNDANEKVMNLASSDDDLQGMGCTLVACYVGRKTVHSCHVGDARCYIANDNKIEQITNDHSYVATFNKNISEDEDSTVEIARPPRHVITRAIGFPFNEEPEYHNREFQAGNRLLLCSDGLWSMVDDNEMHNILMNSETPEKASDWLVNRANEEGGKDNITALVVFL